MLNSHKWGTYSRFKQELMFSLWKSDIIVISIHLNMGGGGA